MNSLTLGLSKYHKIVYKNVKLLVFDMAGTTVNEKGIVYQTLYDTIKNFGLNISQKEISNWHGSNKYEVLNHYLTNDSNVSLEIRNCLRDQLYSNFDNNLKERYFNSSNLELIDPQLPELFQKIQKKNIKIALNTGYSQEIQESIIRRLNMNEFIDDYISSEQVKLGRPYPYMIYNLMERNKIECIQSVMKFGDTQNDILEGTNANCLASVGVLSGADNEEKLKGSTHLLDNVMNIQTD